MNRKLLSLALLMLLLLALLPLSASAQDDGGLAITSEEIEITSGGEAYLSYIAYPTAPEDGSPFPAVILIHSFNGMEEAYRTMTDQFAAEGFVVLAVGWQSVTREPSDDTVSQLLQDSITYLSERGDVDPERIGLTGFCAGGRYTMLFLPQIEGFAAGVAWYGFPNRGTPAAIDLVGDLTAPMLVIHGTEDSPSPIAGIYEYATALDDAGATFELKVYSGEPHGFMLEGGQLREDEVAASAYLEMVDFFKRKL